MCDRGVEQINRGGLKIRRKKTLLQELGYFTWKWLFVCLYF